jgi:curli biogenesis system outer membrane secretion channel CsgG
MKDRSKCGGGHFFQLTHGGEKMKHVKNLMVFLVMVMFFSGCAGGPNLSSVKIGGGDAGPVSGSAASTGDGQKTASAGSNELKRCARNHGRIAIEEQPMGQQTMIMFSQMGMSSFSPTPIARHAIMQSGCFTLVDRGAGFAMGEHEREIAGEMGASRNRQTSTARWALKVEVPQPTTQTGAGVGALASFIPGLGGFAGGIAAVAGSMKFSEAQVVLTVVDLRTSEIVASVTGTGKSSDFGVGGMLLSGVSLGGGMSSKTPEMKVIAAGFVDAINQLVPLMDTVAVATPAPESVTGKVVKNKKK